MASEYYECKEKLSIMDIKKGENDIFVKEEVEVPEIKPLSKFGDEQNANGNEFDAIYLKLEIVEEVPTEIKSFSEYSWDKMVCNGFAGELAKPLVSHYNNGVTLKNEDEGHSKCREDSSTNSVESKIEILKTECDVDIYKDVKPKICEEKSSGKNENESYLNSITDISIGPNFSKDSKTWPQQNRDEVGTAVERDNDTRKEPTITINSSNCPIIQNCPPESKQEFGERPHTEEKPFQCIICSKSFYHKGRLKEHERIHTGEKPFECQICLKSFSCKGNLTKHARVHTGEKPFECKICFKTFVNKSTLPRHATIHTGRKPFQCKICSKSFSQEGHLRRHEIIHTGEKPFQCQICLKSFSRKEHLMEHA